TPREGLDAVRHGQAAAYVGALLTTTHQLIEAGINDIRVVGDVGETFELGMAVRDDWPELVAILDKALDAIPKAERERFRQKWTVIPYERAIDYRPLMALLAVVALAAAFIVQLRRMVRRRTSQLQAEV